MRKKLVTLVLDSAQAYVWGGESITLDGETVGELSSAGYSLLAGACVGLGYLRGPAANRAHEGTTASIDLWGDAVAVRLYDQWPARRPPT